MKKSTADPTPLQTAIDAVVGGLNREHRPLARRERAVLRDVTAVALVRLARIDNELDEWVIAR